MKSVETLASRIEELRTDLEVVMEAENELIDPRVVKASQSLDKVLLQYYRILRIRGFRILEEGVE
ncbi:MAG TPA: aspartyl-phosphate phosphatase Spo0E family protein [Clostridia bacterium]|nr:aspartyl-phosphate phosphatase Spo0E family protein [Clostridia bacterium]